MNTHRRRLMWQLRAAMTALGGLGVACYAAGAPASRGAWVVVFCLTAGLSAASIRRVPRLPLWGEGVLAGVLWAGIALEMWRTGETFEAASNMLALVQGLLAPRADGRWHRVAVGAGVGAHLAAATLLPIDAGGAAMASMCLLGLVVVAGWVLRLWHLERIADEWSASGSVTASEAIRGEGAGRGGRMSALLIGLAAVIFAAGAFVAIPRPGDHVVEDRSDTRALPSGMRVPGPARGKATLTGQGGRRRTGFHDRVDFSNLGPIKRDPRVALTVQTIDVRTQRPAKLGGPLRLRGAAFNRYANRAWSSSGVGIDTVRDTDDDARDGRVALGRPRPGEAVWQQDIERIQLTAPYVFHSGRLLAAGVPELVLDGNGTAAMVQEAPARLRVWCSPSRPNAKVLVRDTVQADAAFAAPLWRHPRGVRLLDTVRRAIAGDETDPYRLVKRIEMGLRRRYKYTLDVAKPPRGREPLELFLSGAHAGHCEYFATAMVLLLRSQQIPSRLVVGYRSSEHDPATGITTIRHAHAHAWVEVRFQHSGWVPFDPTPADSAATDGDSIPVPATGSSISDGLEDPEAGAAAGAAWFDSLMEFDAEERSAVLAQVGGMTGMFIALALTALVGWLAWRGWRRSGMPSPGTAAAARVTRTPPPDFYRALLRVLGRAGFVRRASMTPRELALWVRAENGPAPGAVDKITVTFERLRFGEGGRASGETARTLHDLVDKVAAEAQRARL